MEKSVKKPIFIAMIFFLSSAALFAGNHRGPAGWGEPGERPEMRHSMPKMGPMGPPMFFGNPERMQEDLSLSDSQVDRISKINVEYRGRFVKILDSLEPLHIELSRLITAEKPQLDSIRKKLKEISGYEIEMKLLQISHRIDLEKILTAEQLKKLAEERKERRKMHKEGRR